MFDAENLEHAADSLVGSGSSVEIAAIQSWRSVPGISFLLEQQSYSSAAYTEELTTDRQFLVAALQIVANSVR